MQPSCNNLTTRRRKNPYEFGLGTLCNNYYNNVHFLAKPPDQDGEHLRLFSRMHLFDLQQQHHSHIHDGHLKPTRMTSHKPERSVSKQKSCTNLRFPSPKANLFSFILIISIVFIMETCQQTAAIVTNHALEEHKSSGHLFISKLCQPRSQFAKLRRDEGAMLTSTHFDTDINCTITFKTKSAQQHFIIRFEELNLGCDDHLILFDSDSDYGQQSIKDFSCRDNMASAAVIKTTGTFLTLRYSTDSNSRIGDGFRLVVTTVFDSEVCPPEYASCRNGFCIARSLFCDQINHCVDNSDEIGCHMDDGQDLPYALALLVVLVFIISACVIVFIAAIYCRRDGPYTQYQNQLHRALGVPIQTSSSVMFSNAQPHYQFFQPANFSPYVTPQHHAIATASLPRGYSTLPLNMTRQPIQQHMQTKLTKASNMQANDPFYGNEYLMMTSLSGHPQHVAGPQTARTNLFLPTSQSILPATTIGYTQPTIDDRGRV